MRNVLVVIEDSYTRQDFDAMLILEEVENAEVEVTDSIPDNVNQYDELVVQTNLAYDVQDVSIPICRFSLTSNEENSYSGNLPSYGVCQDATEIFDALQKPVPKKKRKKPKPAQPKYELDENELEEYDPEIQNISNNTTNDSEEDSTPTKKSSKQAQIEEDFEEENVPKKTKKSSRRNSFEDRTPSNEPQYDEDDDFEDNIPKRKKTSKQPQYEDEYEDDFIDEFEEEEEEFSPKRSRTSRKNQYEEEEEETRKKRVSRQPQYEEEDEFEENIPRRKRISRQPQYKDEYEDDFIDEFEEEEEEFSPKHSRTSRRKQYVEEPKNRRNSSKKSPYEEEETSKKRVSRKSQFEDEDDFEENIPRRKRASRQPQYEDEYEDDFIDEFEEDEEEFSPKHSRTSRRKQYVEEPKNRRNPSKKSPYEEEETPKKRVSRKSQYEEEDEFEENIPKKKRTSRQPQYEDEYEDDFEEEKSSRRNEDVPKKKLIKNRKTTIPEQPRTRVNDKPSILSQKKREKELLQAEIETDVGIRKKPAKTVAVYSAKGGVGKTTIASELATVLSRMSNGRREFEVCIVDYNIDFGDVQMTLDYAPDKICLTQFAERVRSDLPAYSNPDDLVYTKNEIRSFLQQNEETGLYALIAPVTNEDSMNISSKELEIILRNIIDNGEFDFIVCDTGNNTRDSTVIALDMADIVLLISTQNATTVNCNDSMLSSLASLHFDIGKMRLVINKIEKEKDVGISADDVWENTLNPYTEKPIELLSKISNSSDVKKASNYHDPLSIRNSSHPFTVQIRKIAAYVAEQESVFEDIDTDGKKKKKKKKKEKKKGFFSSLFGK